MNVSDFYENTNGQPVIIYLSNGVRLSGVVSELEEGMDECLLSLNGMTQIVFMRHVATIVPQNSPVAEYCIDTK